LMHVYIVDTLLCFAIALHNPSILFSSVSLSPSPQTIGVNCRLSLQQRSPL
jgi:hypothetical protein